MNQAGSITRSSFVLLLFIFCFTTTKAQLNYDFIAGRFLIKGKVIDLQTKKAIPLANIKITNLGKGITCEMDGSFAMYVSKGDSLRFSSVGYLSKVIHMSDIDSSRYYTLEIELLRDFVMLKDVIVYPYSDLEDFKKAFVAEKDRNKVSIPGLMPPKYSNQIPHAKFSNPISFLYERIKKRSANPDFKP